MSSRMWKHVSRKRKIQFCTYLLTCFSVHGRKYLCLIGKLLQLPSRAVCLSGIAYVSEGKFRPFFVLLVPLLPRNIKCLLAMVISNDETNTGEFSIYKNSVK